MNVRSALTRSFPLWPFVVAPYVLLLFVGENLAGVLLLLTPPIVGLVAAAGAFFRGRSVLPGLGAFAATTLIAVAVAVPNYIHAFIRGRVATVESDQREMARALETYHARNGFYPVGFIAEKPRRRDVFHGGEPYGYWSDGERWLLWSWGPDKEETLPADWIESATGEPAERWQELLKPYWPESATSEPAERWQELLKAYQYDPTNGSKSRGDIIRTGP